MTTNLDLEIPAQLDALAGARVTVRSWLAEQAIDAIVASDLLAVASEFLLHAIVRAGGVGAVRLVGEHHVDGIRLKVRADAAATAPRSLALPPDPLVSGGIGRRLVEGCCDDLTIATDGDGGGAECWRRVRSA